LLTKGASVMNSTRGKREKIGRMVEMFAKEANPVEEARAGDIIALVSLADTETGDTLCDTSNPVVLERMRFPDPVISVSVKAKNKVDQEKFGTALGKMVRADPSLHLETDRETGQTILRGMGELHLEVTLDRMRTEFGVEGTMGEPQVAYRETITKKITSTRSRPAVPASSPRCGSCSSRWSAARASSSSTKPSAVRCRRSSCPRSRRV
jgi:elongation factor G